MKVIRARKKLKQNTGELAISAQLKEAKADFSFEPHSFKYEIPATYTPDFSVKKKDGSTMYLEIKGYHAGMAAWCSKITHFVKANPDIDYRIIFLNAKKKFNKKYKSNMGDWATRKNIQWADNGRIPDEWIKE